MISRNTIRIKVMQAIYEYHLSKSIHIDRAKRHLERTFDDMYKLYLQMLSFFGALTCTADQVIDLKKQKLLPTETDLHPNYKFVNNLFIKKIDENVFLQKALERHNISWYSDEDKFFTRTIYDHLSLMPFFVEYMQNQENSFEADKIFVLTMIEEFLLENEEVCCYMGEKKLHWLHDYNDVMIMVYNTLRTFSKQQRADMPLPPLFKTNEEGISEDRQFMLDLFMKTVEHNEEYMHFISQRLINWERDRLTNIDAILLKMAICEFCEFPSIPLRVTMNEYIEISKYYSGNKSKNFINGMLDPILLDLKQENKINKQGRGLKG